MFGKYIIKTHYFKSGRSIHFTYRSGVNSERMIGFKLQHLKVDGFWRLWFFFHWFDFGFGFFYRR